MRQTVPVDNAFAFYIKDQLREWNEFALRRLCPLPIEKDPVRFNLNRPKAPFIANLAMDFASILSKEYADTLLEADRRSDLNQKPIGTGPFQFENP